MTAASAAPPPHPDPNSGHARPPPPSAPPTAPIERSKPPPWRNLKLVIPLLIAVVSVTGALNAWRSATLGGAATEKNRELIRETIQLQQIAGRVATQLAADLQTFAEYRIEEMAARRLESEAGLLRGQGFSFHATAAETEARTRHDLAQRLLGLHQLAPFVTAEPNALPTFREDLRRTILERQMEGNAARLDPDAASKEASRLDARSERLVAWIVLLSAIGFMLTGAQVSRRPSVKKVLAAIGACAYVVVATLSFVTTRA